MTHLDAPDTSVFALPDQCLQGWKESRQLAFPKSYRECEHIVFAGTGGSAYGAEIVSAWGRLHLRVPSVVISSGALPVWANKKTLVVVTSYSGSTEEAVALAREAHTLGCKLVVIAKGASLARLARRFGAPAYIFDDRKTNPSQQPRMGSGITLSALLGMLSRLGYLALGQSDMLAAVSQMRKRQRQRSFVKQAETLAKRLVGRTPLLISAEHLQGMLVPLRNQIHENAKHFAIADSVPELNHHLMEGLGHPASVKNLTAVFFPSGSYSKNVKRRMAITKEVLKKQGVPSVDVKVSADTRLAEILVLLSFGGLLSLVLAKANHVDPKVIPWVDYFKAKMAK
jgi:glucose/mannose-6-phosphate isomerase